MIAPTSASNAPFKNSPARFTTSVHIPLSRSKAWRRAATFLLPGLAILFLLTRQIQELNFKPSGVSNRLPEYAWGIVYLFGVVIGLRLAWRGFYWSLVAIWRGNLGITADREQFVVAMGPMGRKVYDSGGIVARYPYDDPEAGDDGLAEGLRDPARYRKTYLPILTHAASKIRLDLLVRHLAGEAESSLAASLHDFIMWRRQANGISEPDQVDPTEA